MGWKEENKGSGPWEFAAQPNKWGYLNNPRWLDPPTVPVNYDGREDEEPQIWDYESGSPIANKTSDPMHTHIPCGHWHKPVALVPTTAPPAALFAIAPQYFDINNSLSGIGIALYDPFTNTWSNGGEYHGGSPTWSQPNTLRMTSTFIAHFADWLDNIAPTYPEYMKLLLFEGGVNTLDINLWTYQTGINRTEFNGVDTHNKMDVSESGLIACTIYLTYDAGVNILSWGIKVSEDKGITWKPTKYFAVNWIPYSSGNIRIDANDVIWFYYEDAANKEVNLYKSTNKGDSWSLVYNASTGTETPVEIVYTIDSTGQYQYVSRKCTDGGNRSKLYKSSDYGVSWTLVYDLPILAASTWNIRHTSNGSNVIVPFYTIPTTGDLFKVSDDYGALFSDVIPGYSIRDFYIDHQRDGEYVIYNECGESFVDFSGISGFLYSLDSGHSWDGVRIPSTPEFSDDVFMSGTQACVDAVNLI